MEAKRASEVRAKAPETRKASDGFKTGGFIAVPDEKVVLKNDLSAMIKEIDELAISRKLCPPIWQGDILKYLEDLKMATRNKFINQ